MRKQGKNLLLIWAGACWKEKVSSLFKSTFMLFEVIYSCAGSTGRIKGDVRCPTSSNCSTSKKGRHLISTGALSQYQFPMMLKTNSTHLLTSPFKTFAFSAVHALKFSPGLAFKETDSCILTNETTQEILWNDEKVKKWKEEVLVKSKGNTNKWCQAKFYQHCLFP